MKLRFSRWHALALLLLSSRMLSSRTVLASGVDTYNAPVSGSDLLLVTRAHAETGHMEGFGRVALAYNNDPLVLRGSDGSEVPVLQHQFGAYGAVGVALWHRLQIAALVPVYHQQGQRYASQPSIDGVAFGDLAFDGRLAILERNDPIELAVDARVALPTGEASRYVGDGEAAAQVSGIVSRQFGEGGLLITSRLTARVRERVMPGGSAGGSGILLGLGVAVPLKDGVMVTAEGELATEVDHFLGEKSTPASLLAGLRWSFGSWLGHVGAGPGVSRGLGTPDFRLLCMLGTNTESTSETTPAAPPVGDADRDRMDDEVDTCPDQPEDRDGVRDDDGCPDLDDDADGISDASDKCPADPEDEDAFEDMDGCPEPDNDRDGIRDAGDECPTEAENVNGIDDADGCPDVDGDDDADGVRNSIDRCTSEKETPNGVDDADGCPDLLRVEASEIRTLEPIYFETGSDRIQERSWPLLQELATVISSRPDLGTISIEGHTDNAGSETYNLELSRKRADALKRFLSSNGVSESRLTASGYGEMRPIASNETQAGREQNRRVEFRLADLMSSHE